MANKTRETANLVSSKTGIAVTISGDPVVLGVGNTERVRITSGGDVFINRTSQLSDAKLSVQSDAGEPLIAAQMGTNTGISTVLQTYNSSGNISSNISVDNANRSLILKGASTEGLRITSDGKISQGGHTPSYEYDLRGTGQQTILVGSENAGGAALILDGDSDGDGSGTDYASILHSSDGNIEINNRKSADIIFKNTSSETERLRITSGGDVQVTTGNLVFSTAGAGIDFSAASGSASGSSSALLDDYEEGSWTPDLHFDDAKTGISYGSGSRYGTYTRIGNIVFCRFMFALSSKGTATGTPRMYGLPFTAADKLDATSIEGEGGITYFDNKGAESGIPYWLPWQGGTYARMYSLFEGASVDSASATEAIFENNSSCRGYFWYYAA